MDSQRLSIDSQPKLEPQRALARLGDGLLMLVSFGLYVRTLAPTVLPADSGEFQLVSFVLGIAHPPGYPLYTLLGKLFTLVPLGDAAYRVSLLSAVISIMSLWVLSRVVQLVTGSALAGWIGALHLAVATTFWAQATTANIRSLTVLLVAVQVYELLAFEHTREHKHLIGFSFALGLGVTHHSSIVPLVLAYLTFLVASGDESVRRWRTWAKPLVAFGLALLILLYLPLRSRMNPAFDPAPIRSLSDFVEHVLALGFRGDMFYFVQPAQLIGRLQVLANILNLQFSLSWLLTGMVGTVCLLLFKRSALLLVGGVFCINSVLAVTYRAPQTVEYLMPGYWTLCVICACGLWELMRRLGWRWLITWAWIAAGVLPLWTFSENYASFAELSRSRYARVYAEDLLQETPQGARILSNWHYATVLWYLQYVEGMRPDVDVTYVYPEGAEPIVETWIRRIAESTAERPTIVTNQYIEFRSTPYSFRPAGGAFRVDWPSAKQGLDRMQELHTLLGETIELIGYSTGSEVMTAADTMTVRVYWTPVAKLDRDYSVFVHLVNAAGAPVGQGDTRHSASQYAIGQVILDEYTIPLLPTSKPGRYRLVAGIYFTPAEGGWQRLLTADGQDHVLLTEVEVTPLRSAPVTQRRLQARSTEGYTLLGVDYDRSVADQLRVYLHWQADRGMHGESAALLWSQGTSVATVALSGVPSGYCFSTVSDLPASTSGLSVEVQPSSGGVSGTWSVLAGFPLGRRLNLPSPGAKERYVPFGDEMVLVAADYPPMAVSDKALRVALTFVGARPITHDYTMSVHLAGEDGTFWAQQDGTPAMGAIPTLKWIRGTRVRDEHVVALPAMVHGKGVLRLTVYDAFTMRPLPVLDERLARLGQGTQLEIGSVLLP